MATWKLDKAHSEVKFKARHLLVSTVTGEFREFDGTVETEGDGFNNAKIYFEADINSINTRNEQRDAHLKSEDFFDAANYPKMTFISKSIRKVADSEFQIIGDLTIRGITKEITVKAEFNGLTTGFGGVKVAGFELTGKINRFDYGLRWNVVTEAGGIVVGEEIKIEVNAELNEVK